MIELTPFHQASYPKVPHEWVVESWGLNLEEKPVSSKEKHIVVLMKDGVFEFYTIEQREVVAWWNKSHRSRDVNDLREQAGLPRWD